MTEQITVPKQTWDAMREALNKLLKRDQRNTCQHEETHRGGVIWEICEGCGMKWADDRGGKPKWKDPSEWSEADAVLTAANAVSAQSSDPAALSSEVKPLSSKPQAPYANCRFRICDLPGQCKGEGKCHHPAVPCAANAVHQQAQGELYGWLYDWTHSSATGRPDETFTTFTTDKAHALKHENVRAVYAHPQATEPALTEHERRYADSLTAMFRNRESKEAIRSAMEPAEKRKLYECTGCGHLYDERPSSCDCTENPGRTYNDWVATPAAPEAKQ